jgi:hypothetical protein
VSTVHKSCEILMEVEQCLAAYSLDAWHARGVAQRRAAEKEGPQRRVVGESRRENEELQEALKSSEMPRCIVPYLQYTTGIAITLLLFFTCGCLHLWS